MRKLMLIFMLGMFFAFPFSVSAQSDTTLSFVTVQLWPEYDDPSMLVIVDFQTAANTTLPVTLDFRIPAEASLVAVASDAGNSRFMDHPYTGPVVDGEYQTFSMVIEEDIAYRFEYYQPLTFNDKTRIFSYLWNDGYAVNAFQYMFLEPLDVTSVTLNPNYVSQQSSNGLNYYEGAPVQLAAGEQYVLTLQYDKTSDTLVSQSQNVQIAEPVNEDTPGRVSLANSLPYVIGALGVIMIVGGLAYYFQWGRSSKSKSRRKRSHASAEGEGTGVYCPQCGTRAKGGDRFCRTCGTRLRQNE